MDLSALTAPPSPAQATLSGAVEAVVATTPADPSEGVYVLVGAGQQRLGPCRWMGTIVPQRGAACVVMAAGNGHFMLLWYESEANGSGGGANIDGGTADGVFAGAVGGGTADGVFAGSVNGGAS